MEGDKKSAVNMEEFELLFRSNHKFLCMIAMGYVHDHFIAEDLVQEFFIDFWQRRETIVLTGSFEAYARRAVKYKSIDYLRRHDVLEKRNSELEVSEETASVEEEAEQESLQQERYIQIMEMINLLPEERRNIFIMHAMEKLNYAQIAERKQISVNTVKTQLRRAYLSLRNKSFSIFSGLF